MVSWCMQTTVMQQGHQWYSCCPSDFVLSHKNTCTPPSSWLASRGRNRRTSRLQFRLGGGETIPELYTFWQYYYLFISNHRKETVLMHKRMNYKCYINNLPVSTYQGSALLWLMFGPSWSSDLIFKALKLQYLFPCWGGDRVTPFHNYLVEEALSPGQEVFHYHQEVDIYKLSSFYLRLILRCIHW